jgi:hypothetical protein
MSELTSAELSVLDVCNNVIITLRNVQDLESTYRQRPYWIKMAQQAYLGMREEAVAKTVAGRADMAFIAQLIEGADAL